MLLVIVQLLQSPRRFVTAATGTGASVVAGAPIAAAVPFTTFIVCVCVCFVKNMVHGWNNTWT